MPERPWFVMKFGARCSGCDAEIAHGALASYSRAEPGVIICKECADEEDEV